MTKVATAFLVGRRHGQDNGNGKNSFNRPYLATRYFLTVLLTNETLYNCITLSVTLSNSQKEKPKSKSKGKPEKTKKKAKKESDEESGDEEEESEEEDADISGGSDSD